LFAVLLILFAADSLSIQLEIYVDKRTAPQLNSGKEKIDDILVLHLEGGKDFFVSLIFLRVSI
jgi:inositol polyphosphate 5-phosphatase INPP5B/F